MNFKPAPSRPGVDCTRDDRPYNLIGTDRVGLATVWHNATAMTMPAPVVAVRVAPPLMKIRTIEPLVGIVLGDR